ncbi:hypothetical protein IW262DRAFT_961283 [Armillaria fumosa]|nr:hypothetical protein IW262DRAFT_961283 [Armillaria fumosa]
MTISLRKKNSRLPWVSEIGPTHRRRNPMIVNALLRDQNQLLPVKSREPIRRFALTSQHLRPSRENDVDGVTLVFGISVSWLYSSALSEIGHWGSFLYSSCFSFLDRDILNVMTSRHMDRLIVTNVCNGTQLLPFEIHICAPFLLIATKPTGIAWRAALHFCPPLGCSKIWRLTL